MKRELTAYKQEWPLREPFVIARGTQTVADVVLVELKVGGVIGRGEAAGVDYHGETLDSVLAQIESVRPHLRNGIGRQELSSLLPAGGARNAIDCALWDLEAKQSGHSIWQLACIDRPEPISSNVTIGIRSLEGYGARARELADCPWIKIKVNAQSPLEAIRAVRAEAPHARLVVDANQAWSIDQLQRLADDLVHLRVDLLEQPVSIDDDDGLLGLHLPIPICADEPANTAADLPRIADRYDFVNIKLDKTGGLTEALAMAREAPRHGLRLMVGCMLGTSLAMAPAFIVAQLCEVADLDGPVLLAKDHPDGFVFNNGVMRPFNSQLWG